MSNSKQSEEQRFIESNTLPTHHQKVCHVNSREALEAAGIKFGEVDPENPILQQVELPKGWKKVPTDHSMWSILLDEKGRERASIFYNAAFFSAHYSASCRYTLFEDFTGQEGLVIQVLDGETVIYSSEPIKTDDERIYFQLYDKAETAATEWLEEHFPNWQDPTAYWD